MRKDMIEVAQIIEGFEAEVYLKALIAVAQADGVSSSERDFIQNQATLLGVDEVNFEMMISLDDLSNQINAVTRRIIVRDCIVLATVDGDYTENERRRIAGIAEALGVTPERTAQLENWLQQYSDLLEEGQRLLVRD